MIRNLALENSILNQFITEIRDVEIQKDSMRFRKNLERIGEVAAYEISKTLAWEEKEITTPLGIANCKVLQSQPVLATILRAGLGMHTGLLNYFDKGQNAFISSTLLFPNPSSATPKTNFWRAVSANGALGFTGSGPGKPPTRSPSFIPRENRSER